MKTITVDGHKIECDLWEKHGFRRIYANKIDGKTMRKVFVNLETKKWDVRIDGINPESVIFEFFKSGADSVARIDSGQLLEMGNEGMAWEQAETHASIQNEESEFSKASHREICPDCGYPVIRGKCDCLD